MRTDVWTWDEDTATIHDAEQGLVARVVSDSAADPGDGDGPIMAAARDLLTALEAAFALLEEHEPVWYQRRHFTRISEAIKKARQ